MVDALLDAVMYILHVAIGGLWAGAVLFFVYGLLPAGRSNAIAVRTLEVSLTRLRWLTRAGVVIFLVTGGHLAAARYTSETLLETTNGQLVLLMLGLWLVLTALVEIGGARLLSGVEENSVSGAIDQTQSLFHLAGACAALLLITAGLLGSGYFI